MRKKPRKIYRAYRGSRRGGNRALAIAGIVLMAAALLLPACYINHRIRGRSVELDCPHYVHDHEYQRIGTEIRDFIQALSQ